MADITKDQVIEFLGNMTVVELNDLVKELEEKWGVSAAAPVAVAAAGPVDSEARVDARARAGRTIPKEVPATPAPTSIPAELCRSHWLSTPAMAVMPSA